jgi:hypothetical protein
MEQNELVDQIAFGTQDSTSSVDCGTSSDLESDTGARLRAEIAFDCSIDALTSLRNREEKKFREMQGWGPLLRASQYAAMNRFVDRIMIDSVEMERVRETRKAWYATPKGGSR